MVFQASLTFLNVERANCTDSDPEAIHIMIRITIVQNNTKRATDGVGAGFQSTLMRESIRSIDRDLAVPELRSLRSSIDEGQFEGPRSGMAVLGTVSVFALAPSVRALTDCCQVYDLAPA